MLRRREPPTTRRPPRRGPRPSAPAASHVRTTVRASNCPVPRAPRRTRRRARDRTPGRTPPRPRAPAGPTPERAPTTATPPPRPPRPGRRAPRGRTPSGPPTRSRDRLLADPAEDLLVSLPHPIVLRPRADQGVPELPHRGASRLRLPERPDLEQELLERPPVIEMAEDEVQLPDDELEHVDLAVEQLHQVRLDRVLRPEVHDVHLALLAQPVHAADPLLDPKRVPREVVVDDRPRELQVPALPARLRAQEHLGVLLERADGRVLGGDPQAPMVRRNAVPIGPQDPLQVPEGAHVLREDERLFVERPQEGPQSVRLDVRRDRTRIVPEAFEPLAVLRAERRTAGEPIERLRDRERAAADLPLQHDQREPCRPREPPGGSPVRVAHELRDVVVEASLGRSEPHREAVHPPGRQREGDPSAIADHDVSEPSAQLRHPRGHSAVRARDVPLEEAIIGVQRARLEEAD